MSEVLNQPTQPARTDTAEDGSIDAAAQAFASRDTTEETAETDPDQDKQQADDATPEEGADAETDESPADDVAEVEIEGETYQVPAKLKDGYLRQADYTRKTQEVAAQGKMAEERLQAAEKLAASAEKKAEALAEVRAIDAQLKQYEALEWAKIRAENPAEYAALAADLQTLRIARSDADNKAKAVAQEVDGTQNELIARERAAMLETLAKSLKGWGDAKGAELSEYATKNGVRVETLRKLTDAGLVIALDKARKYDQLQAEKTTLKAKAQDAPRVVKPGAPARKSNDVDLAMAKLRKDGTQDAAAAAFLARDSLRSRSN